MRLIRAILLAGIVAAMVMASGVAAAPATSRISLNTSGTQGNGVSWNPDTTEDGNLVAFTSFASNLVPDSNGQPDIFVKDRVTSLITRVSVTNGGIQSNGASSNPTISGNGRHVAFQSGATNLVTSDLNAANDVFVRDTLFGQTTIISVSTSGTQGNLDSEQPSISNDGRYIAFTSQANNIATPDSNGGYDVFLRDRDTDADGIFDESGAVSTTLVSLNSAGTDSGNHFSYGPQISGNGRYVAFLSYASDIGPGATNGVVSDVYVRDLQSGTTVRVSESTSGTEGDGDSGTLGISDDGRYVAFTSWATNMVTGDTNGLIDIFLRDRDTDADGIFDEAGAVSTTRVNVSTAGAEANGSSFDGQLSGDGRSVVFQSAATNLVSGDTNGFTDVFVRDLIKGTTTRVSVDSSGTESNNESYYPAISGNGCSVLYSSDATNLDTGDTNGSTDVFAFGKDTDGDALCDDWEINGIDYDGDTVVDLALDQAPYNADPNHKDIFVEIDWMDCNQGGCTGGDTHNHQPDSNALQDVVNRFAIASVNNPDNQSGIDLHLMTDEAVGHQAATLFLSNGAGTTDDFNDIKQGNPVNPCGTSASDGHFGTSTDRGSANCANILAAKRLVFRYTIFGHDWGSVGNGSSGIAELPGNDFMVTLGSWSANSIQAVGGQRAAESAVFMHEMGHTLGLRHGGADNVNCKPNYLSVMSYSLTFTNMDPTRPLDYSRYSLPQLNESSLSEPAGIGGPAGRRTIYGTGGTAHWWYANTGADWNFDGDTIDTGISEDLNTISTVGGCTTSSPGEKYIGQNDWQNIKYDFRGSSDFADGPRATVPSTYEITDAEALTAAQSIDFDDDGLSNADDNCPAVPNPGQDNSVHPGTFSGDDCEDFDEDGFVDGDEDSLGTDPSVGCGFIAGGMTPSENWPPDLIPSDGITISDVLALKPVFNTAVPPTSARYDLVPSGSITISDVLRLKPVFNTSCVP